MALITCPKCGKQVSDKALKCPHCGWDVVTLSSQTESRVSVSEIVTTTNEKHHRKWPVFVITGLCLVAAIAALWFFVLKDIKGGEGEMVENPQTNNASDSTAPNDKYLTQDLRMWDLFGPVRDFQTRVSRVDGPSRFEDLLDYYDEETLYNGLSRRVQFDTQGHFDKTIDGSFTTEEVTNKDRDRILVAKRYVGEMDGYITKQWSYYPNGLVSKCVLNGYENNEECQFFYNDLGELIKTEEIGWPGPDGWKIISVYSVKERDEHGNWTKRLADITQYEYDYNTNDFKYKADGHEMYYRTIRYYDTESSIQFVVINATELRLRLGPSKTADTYKWSNGTNRHPNKGDRFPYLGESGEFYKIDYDGHEVWVSKQYTYLE